MKKLALILVVLFALSLASCSNDVPNTPDTPNTPEITTSTPNTSAEPDETELEETTDKTIEIVTTPPEELPVIQRSFMPDNKSLTNLAISVYKNQISFEDFLSDQSAQKFIVKNLSEILDAKLRWSDINVYVESNREPSKGPVNMVLSLNKGYDTIVNFNIFENGAFLYYIPVRLYGRYEKDSIGILTQPEYLYINISDMEDIVLGMSDIDNLVIRYNAVTVSEEEGKIIVPSVSDTKLYVAVLKIEDDLSYTLETFDEIDPKKLSARDFFITYRSFAFKPVDLVENDYEIPLSPENAIMDIFGTLEVLDGMQIYQSFPNYPYTLCGITLETSLKNGFSIPGIEVSFNLKNKLSGQYMEMSDIESEITLDNFEWVFCEVDYS